jgi:hypothetical protein
MRSSFVIAVLLLVLGNCRSPSDPGSASDLGPESALRMNDCDGPATSLPPLIAATLPPRSGHMQPDDRWADLAAEVPGGFAGVLYDNGRPVLMLTRPNEAAAAKAALAEKLGGFPVASADVRAARWDFRQLVDWSRYLVLQPTVQSAGIMTSDNDEAANRIRFGVKDADARLRLVHALVGLNIPCDLVLIEIAQPIIAL